MKRFVRALAGILATIVIVIMIERTMINFEFFPESEGKTADTLAIAQAQQDSLVKEEAKKKVNPVIKAKDLITIGEDRQIEANKIYKKEVFYAEEYMVNINYPDTVRSYSNGITVTFEFDRKDFAKNVLFIVFDCLDNQTSKTIKKFYQPVQGLNRVKLNKDKLSPGYQTFRLGYFLKNDATKKRVIFNAQEFKIFIEE